ncbi:hypothetical protein [Bacillus alveayuensis]|uniref:hypothetical protein n=1 Tax=Aeribacillus alveayuensis TaxID=279215 RepID=UPI0005CD71A7|nr:hypothetical protein [Bacillus alveayuensis]
MSKKWLLKLSGSLLAALLITGCNVNGDNDDQNPPPPGENQDIDDNDVDDGNVDTDMTPNNDVNDNDVNDNDRMAPGQDTNEGLGDDEDDAVRDSEDAVEDPKDMNDRDNRDE